MCIFMLCICLKLIKFLLLRRELMEFCNFTISQHVHTNKNKKINLAILETVIFGHLKFYPNRIVC